LKKISAFIGVYLCVSVFDIPKYPNYYSTKLILAGLSWCLGGEKDHLQTTKTFIGCKSEYLSNADGSTLAENAKRSLGFEDQNFQIFSNLTHDLIYMM
jgi:hypothetical protein